MDNQNKKAEFMILPRMTKVAIPGRK